MRAGSQSGGRVSGKRGGHVVGRRPIGSEAAAMADGERPPLLAAEGTPGGAGPEDGGGA